MKQINKCDEFVIDNTPLLIFERLFWFVWFVLFYIVLFIFIANIDIGRGVTYSYSEFFINQLGNGRFFY
ncbi:MAG: hypothetical protein B7X89_09395 [Sulfuricurvum sp. 17-40-25]|nr:MAG: hypothetical protein B7Y30_10250 [Campylobacterales bacterium 16-40-21]OZA02438.1 MAG: hypothetical protein B7X89_09395 [Sulfuricurvum sp. 17-40-25]